MAPSEMQPAEIHQQWITEKMADYSQENQDRMREILGWVTANYPALSPVVKWNQPMFSQDVPFIIGFSVATQHVSVSIQKTFLEHFRDRIEESGYSQSSMIFRIRFNQEVDYQLLGDMIDYARNKREGSTTFWLKE